MSNDNRAYGYLRIQPPLNWAEIRQVNEALDTYRGTPAIQLSLTKTPRHTDEGTITVITASSAEVYEEQAYGVLEFLKALEKLSDNHDFDGEFIVVEEFPEFDMDNNREAVRYSFVKGKLVRQYPEITWGAPEEVK